MSKFNALACANCGNPFENYDDILKINGEWYCEDCADNIAVRDIVGYYVDGEWIDANDVEHEQFDPEEVDEELKPKTEELE